MSNYLGGPIHTSSTKGTKTTTKKKKKPQTRAAQLKADKAKRKADFDAHQKAREKKGQGKMTLKERQAADRKEAQAAAAKKHDEWMKKNKRGKYSTRGKKKEEEKKKNLRVKNVTSGNFLRNIK